MLSRAARFWRTARHLKPVQVTGRIRFRLSRPRPDTRPAPPRRVADGVWQAPAARRASLMGPRHFRFLNEEGCLDEIGWDDPSLPKLWRYNQHYFDDLNAEDAAARAGWHQMLIESWIVDNSPGSGSGWEPYPVSLRIVNWVKRALSGHGLSGTAEHSLAVQARWLTRRLEWHLLGNHLFANAKALIHAGLYFDGEEAAGWLRQGFDILAREFDEQILPDGGQFERSPMYHALAIEDVLDLVNIARAFPAALDALCRARVTAWEERVPAMLRWLAVMSHPDDRIAFFNDAAFAIAPGNAALRAYAGRLGIAAPAPAQAPVHLPQSGYARLAVPDAVVIADIGPVGPDYLPGHAHADTLSFEMSLGGRRLIVNTGTSVYGTGADRRYERGTAAHATLTVDDRDSSEVWAGFRVGRRARAGAIDLHEDAGRQILSADHDGYGHLPGAPRHHRTWALEDGALAITDRVTGAGRHALAARFPLMPGVTAEVADGAAVLRTASNEPLARIRCDGGVLSVEDGYWAPEFGLRQPSRCLVLQAGETVLPHVMTTRIDWSAP